MANSIEDEELVGMASEVVEGETIVSVPNQHGQYISVLRVVGEFPLLAGLRVAAPRLGGFVVKELLDDDYDDSELTTLETMPPRLKRLWDRAQRAKIKKDGGQ